MHVRRTRKIIIQSRVKEPKLITNGVARDLFIGSTPRRTGGLRSLFPRGTFMSTRHRNSQSESCRTVNGLVWDSSVQSSTLQLPVRKAKPAEPGEEGTHRVRNRRRRNRLHETQTPAKPAKVNPKGLSTRRSREKLSQRNAGKRCSQTPTIRQHASVGDRVPGANRSSSEGT